MSDVYQAYAPGGALIVAGYDWIPGNAEIQDESWYLDDDGHLRFEWNGGTDLCWDGVQTQTHQGRAVFVDENGQGVDEKDIILVNKTTGQTVEFPSVSMPNIFNDEYVETMTMDLLNAAEAVLKGDADGTERLLFCFRGLRDVMGRR